MQKSLVKNSIYNILYTTINIIFPLVTSIYSARILLPAGVGTVVYSQNIASYFVTFAALGLPSYGVREFAKIRDNAVSRNRLFTELILLNFISTTIAVAIYILFLLRSGPEIDTKLYLASGAVVFFNYFNIDWLYRGIEEYGYITRRSFLIKILSFVSLVLFVKKQEDYIVYAWISSLATGSNHLFNVWHARKFVSFCFLKLKLSRHMRPLLAIALIIFLGSAYSKVDITMLGMLASKEAVGYYSHAQKIVIMVITVANAITGALLPRLSYYFENDRPAFYDLLKKGFDILCLVAFPLAVGLFLVAEQTVILLYGASFIPAIKTIRLLCPIVLIKSFGDLFCYQLAYSTKNEKIIIPASGFAAVLNIAANAALIPLFQQNGAVIASLFSELLTNAIQFVYIKRKVKFHLNCRSLLISLVTTAFMAIIVLCVMYFQFSLALSILLEVVCGAIAYVTANIVFKNPLVNTVLHWIKRKMTHV